jgi:hypothetical protein
MPKTTGSGEGRFADRRVVFENGSEGVHIEIASASPLNYHQVLSEPEAMPRLTIDGG